MTAIEAGLGREHVHRPALAARGAADSSGQLGHDLVGVHARGQHVTVVTIAGDDLVAFFAGGLHAHRNSFLADIQVAEAADQAHAVKLARALLEPADQEHVPIVLKEIVLSGLCELGLGGARSRHLNTSAWRPPRPLTPGPATP